MPYGENSLTHICNISLESSKFPDAWKTVSVTPIFKGRDKSDKSNYRPLYVYYLRILSRRVAKWLEYPKGKIVFHCKKNEDMGLVNHGVKRVQLFCKVCQTSIYARCLCAHLILR